MSQTPSTNAGWRNAPADWKSESDSTEYDLDLGDTYWSGAGRKSGQQSPNWTALGNSLTGLAGSLGHLFGDGGSKSVEDYIAGARKVLEEMTGEAEEKVDERISNIYPGLTGLTGEQALAQYYENFANTIRDVQARGRADLDLSPDISSEYGRLSNRVGEIQDQYSLANRVGGYTNLALDPAVVQIDEGRLRGAGERFMDPKYKQMYDYSDPQTSRFIYGSRNTADAIGKYYNTSGDVAGLMNYGNVG
jgi:hypothetical protein